MPLTPQEVAGKVFGPTRMRRGYDENEVDAFLDQVEGELTRLTTENERLKNELEQARRQLVAHGASAVAPATAVAAAASPAAEPGPTAQTERAEPQEPSPAAPVVVAQPAPAAAPDDQAVEHRVARMLVLAQQTADAALREAQTEADRMRGDARVEAERMVSEARARTAEEIGRLQRSKSTLEGEVEQLQTFEREYRQRLRAYLAMQLRELDHDSGPAAVEGGSATALDHASHNSGDSHGVAFSKTTPAPSVPGSAGLSEPPAFGPVWSPGERGEPASGS